MGAKADSHYKNIYKSEQIQFVKTNQFIINNKNFLLT